jgi:GT2 family glycosyltransferase
LSKNKIDIAIISYNCYQLTADCIDSVYATASDVVGKVIVVDNSSTDGTPEKLHENYPEVELIANSDNRGYAAAVNQAIAASTYEFTIVSNADVVFLENSVQELMQCLEANPKIGICGPQQIYGDGTWEYSYGMLPGLTLGIKNLFCLSPIIQELNRRRFRSDLLSQNEKEVGYIDGAVCCIRRSAFEEVGGFDEDYFFYAEEMDFNFRIQQRGWKSVFCPKSRVIHYRGGSSAEIGYDQAKVEMFINAKFLYFEKNLCRTIAKIYSRMEIIHLYEMSWFWSFAGKILGGSKKEKARGRVQVYDILKVAWKKGLQKFEEKK